jgi:hypothetical protein
MGKDSDGNVYAYNGKKWVGWDSTENVKRKVKKLSVHTVCFAD